MRIVDFKELLKLPAHTLFSLVDCKVARHGATIKEVYTKLPVGPEGLSFHGDRVNVLEGHEFSLPEVNKAYVRSESLDIPQLMVRTMEFTFSNCANCQFAVWEKPEIEELMAKFKRALSVFTDTDSGDHPSGANVSN